MHKHTPNHKKQNQTKRQPTTQPHTRNAKEKSRKYITREARPESDIHGTHCGHGYIRMRGGGVGDSREDCVRMGAPVYVCVRALRTGAHTSKKYFF